MTLTRIDPSQLFGTHNPFNRFFEPIVRTGEELREPATGGFIPPVDISEKPDRLLLRVELPGLTEDQIDIQVAEGVLTLKGERKFEQEETEENFHRVERSYGSFTRSFTLPTTVDEDAITAQFTNGVLAIDLPKQPDEPPKTTKVQITTGTE